MPKETIRASISSMDLPPGKPPPFWDAQLSATSSLVERCRISQANRDACIPPEIRPDAGKFQTVAPKQLMDQNGLGGARWLDQFAFDLPIYGHLSQKHLFDPDCKDSEQLRPTQLFGADRPRIRERSAKSCHKIDQALWGEAWGQVVKGWLLPPQQLRSDGRPLRWQSDSFNISFRIGVLQAD